MHGRRIRRSILAMLAISTLAATSGPAAHAQDAPPVTLRLITADGQGRASDRPLTDFIARVTEASGGAITIEPFYEAATTDRPEQELARRLSAGEADLLMTTIRAWDEVGNRALDAIQTPFLIDSDALADAVVSSSIATDLLATLSDQQLIGLAMWPEEMRHFAVFDACKDPINTPADLQGVAVRAAPSTIITEVLTSLGATTGFGDPPLCEFQALEIGLRQGPAFGDQLTLTGDITPWPKVQTLVANGAAFERLPERWQAVIRTAAAEASAHEVEIRDADQASQPIWCGVGHSVVLAGPEATTAFQEAMRPVADRMAADPATGPFVAAITALKTELGAATTAVDPCDGAVPPGPFEPQQGPSPVDGVWVTSTTREQLASSPLLYDTGEINDGNWGDIRIQFEDGVMTYDLTNPRETFHSVGTYRVDGDRLSIYDPAACCPPQPFSFGFTIEGDTLTLTRLPGYVGPTPYILDSYTRVAE
jgi:TRAP-type C4-dicarboxylate transport system substrate-binding protein